MSEKELTIYEIPDDTQYWLVRADGGKYYKDFEYSNTISIQDNDLSLELFNGPAMLSHEVRLDYYKKKIASVKPEFNPHQVSIAAKKMLAFINQMKIGDIVIVPSKQTKHFLIGVILSEPYELTDKQLEDLQKRGERMNYKASDNIKRRKVKWLNEVSRNRVNSNFFYTLTMHQSIIDVSDTRDYIAPLLSPIYIQDNKLTLCIRVNTPRGITSETWQSLYTMINELKNTKINESIVVKSNVQSPGFIVLTSSLTQFIEGMPLSLSGLIVIYQLLLGDIEFKGYRIKGLIPTAYELYRDWTMDKKEAKSKDLDNEMKALEVREKELELAQKEKDQQLADLQRERESIKISNEIEMLNLSLDEPKAPNANGFQMQMDFDDFENEE